MALDPSLATDQEAGSAPPERFATDLHGRTATRGLTRSVLSGAKLMWSDSLADVERGLCQAAAGAGWELAMSCQRCEVGERRVDTSRVRPEASIASPTGGESRVCILAT
jgi:hypothetical protein